MEKKTFTITFKTITPLFTGNASGEMTKIEPSSIMGSLRFWFERFCCFSGIENKMDSLNDSLDQKAFKNAFKNALRDSKLKEKNRFEVINKILADNNISIPSRIFGCTGWKSLVEIEKLDYSTKDLKKINYKDYDKNIFRDSSFWIKKSLFNNKSKMKVFDGDFNLTLGCPRFFIDKYLKKFFSFLNQDFFLMGGKNSFGLGFLKIKKFHNLTVTELTTEFKNKLAQRYFTDHIEIPIDKQIFGYNLKYFIRELEATKSLREYIFGKPKKKSNLFISIKTNNLIYLIGFTKVSNYFDRAKVSEMKELLKKEIEKEVKNAKQK